MSVNTNYTVRDTTLELWTDPTQIVQVVPSDQEITAVSIPFYYWRSVSNGPLSSAGVSWYAFREKPLADERSLPNPDLSGRLIISVNGKAQLNEETLTHALQDAENRIKQREGYYHLLFQMCVPLSTRTCGETVQSLFPCLKFGQDYLRYSLITDSSTKILVAVVSTIIDLATLIIRLVILIPRFIYQHYFQTHDPIGITVQTNGENVDWGRGLIRFLIYTKMSTLADPAHTKKFTLGTAKENVYLGC